MTTTTTLKIASALLLSLAGAGIAQAATVPADKYGYEFRTPQTFTDGAHTFDVHSDGARGFDTYSEGARGFNPHQDGARAQA